MHKYTFFIFKSLLQCESSFTKPLNLKSKGISMYFHVFRIHLPHQETPFRYTKNHPSSAQHAPFHCAACESRCCHNSSAPGDPFGIFPAGIWPPTHPAGIFWHPPPQGTLEKPKQQGKTGKNPTKSRTSQPAIKNVWLRFWYVLISVFFVHAFKAWSCLRWSSTTAKFVTSEGIFCALLYDLWGAVVTQKRPRVSTKNNTHANITYVISWYLICVSCIISLYLWIQIYWVQCL